LNLYWNGGRVRVQGDFNGDGKSDFLLTDAYSSNGSIVNPNTKTYIYQAEWGIPDLISLIDNGIGGATTISYQPSSAYPNNIVSGKVMPFVIQTISSVEINDGNGNISRTEYYYENGNFDFADRSFWGFDYISATSLYNYDPGNGACINNSDYDCTISETWFNNEDYEYKGLPVEQTTSNSTGALYTKSVNTYDSRPEGGSSVFPYLEYKNDYIYDGTAAPLETQTDFEYDNYGNIKRKYLHGDLAVTGDERDEYTEYSYDTGKWIALPSVTCLKLPAAADCSDESKIKARTSFIYYPNTGNLKAKTSWLDGGTDPVVSYTYDSYGNVETVTDPNQNLKPVAESLVTLITYDTATHTFPVRIDDPGGNYVEKTYHNVFIGKVETETDANKNPATYRYDEFGRITKVVGPDDTDAIPTAKYEYPALADYGRIGVQKVKKYALKQHGVDDYLLSEGYFDGLGRTFKTESNGPDSKTIVTETQYDDRGLVYRESLPYFKNEEPARWTTYDYDAIGRLTRTDYHDTTYATSEYLKGTLTYIDPNGHKKVEVKDIYGRVSEIQEYMGNEANGFTLYATTKYDYDLLGNLEYVTDEYGNQTHIAYDTLSRKTYMDDPDMGKWYYDYDTNGNLIYQKDAKLQEVTFEYDELNRITRKIYVGSSDPDIVYTYDEAFSTNQAGRLTTLVDASGTTKFYFDKPGNTIKTIKTIDSVDYKTETTYDALGRIETLKYPDDSIIEYEYGTGGELKEVKDITNPLDIKTYAAYSNYNALGQYGLITFANGVTTTYQYRADNNRLQNITTNNPSSGDLINLTYGFDYVGNITQITDNLVADGSKNRTYTYDSLNRLTEANSPSYGGSLVYQYDKAGNMTYNSRYGHYEYEDSNHVHAVTKVKKTDGTLVAEYAYDVNGNMESGAGRTFSYDYDNRPTSIAYDGKATVSVYDASGFRVKKTIPDTEITFKTTTYIGDLYECTEGECTKYIFSGSDRIAKLDDTKTYYYHSDHLGSSTVVTDETADTAQEIFYYPYGEIKTNTGLDVAKHKFTDQEWDAETGLYYYNARYYDPKLARFISADTIVPDPLNPQALNRYSYVINNPLKYTDPSGHGWWSDFWDDVQDFLGEISDFIDEVLDWVGIDVANINVQVDMAQHDIGNGGGGVGSGSSGGSNWIEYIGPGSQKNGSYGSPGPNISSSGDGPGGLQYASDNGIILYMSFYNRYSDYNDNGVSAGGSVNRGMYPAQIKVKQSSKRDNFAIGLGVANSIISLAYLATPPSHAKLILGAAGSAITGVGVGYTIYQFMNDEISETELGVSLAVDLTPMLGKSLAPRTAKHIAEAVEKVAEHQIGLGEVFYEFFIKPQRQ
jgi:RHS repeat-associated protein